MKKLSLLLILTLVLGLCACGKSDKKETIKEESAEVVEEEPTEPEEEKQEEEETIKIRLSNGDIFVNEEEISEDPEAESGVYLANDIIFYQENQGIAYGEGKKADEHSQIEADAHTVVHITRPGTYELSGTMSAGQIFVDLGEDAKSDPQAAVTLILNGVDITCTVAPAIIFQNVYECAAEQKEETETAKIDTGKAGANIYLLDETENHLYGSYVAKIFESAELNEEGTEVEESKKLYKFDGALYSRMTMNIFGSENGILKIDAEKEGICSEKHLTVYGGTIEISSGNDGINVNENDDSVFTMNGGNIKVVVNGKNGEGDGIDSNGALVINGGNLESYACGFHTDSGLDSEYGVSINGGTVISTGDVLDQVGEGMQKSVVFECQEQQTGGETYQVKDSQENVIVEFTPENDFRVLLISKEGLRKTEDMTLWMGKTQIELQ